MARIVGVAVRGGKFLGFVDSKGKVRKVKLRRIKNPQESTYTVERWAGTKNGWEGMFSFTAPNKKEAQRIRRMRLAGISYYPGKTRLVKG